MNISHEEYYSILRQDFTSFIERSFYELNPETELLLAPYIEIMADKLEACRRGEITRLIINLPPRYLKSHCASIAFVAWILGHQPFKHIICASYGQDLADKLALDCRRLMSSAFYKAVFNVGISSDKQAVSDFHTTGGGSRMATSVGGVLTGRGADFIVIDDPLKPEDALSEAKRNAVNDWFISTLLSRLNNKSKGCIIVIMQRLHQDDLVGHILGLEDWDMVSFPAIAEHDEIHQVSPITGKRTFYRKTGESLHEERENIFMLNATRARIGDYNFSSQYQQNPIPIGGAMIKTGWLQYYDEKPSSLKSSNILQSWDTANTSNELSDYSVCTTWAEIKGQYYLLDVYRARLNYPELKRAVALQFERYKPDRVVIENKASGTQLIQELQSERFRQVTSYKPPAGSDKIMRLHAQTALFENGLVFLPRQASWLQEYIHELTSFPGSRHDDQVDSTSQALDYMKQNQSNLAIWEKLGR